MMKIFLKIYVNQQDIILQSQKLQMFRRYQSSQMKEVNLSQASQRSVSNIHEFSNPSRNDHEDQQKSQVIISFKFNSKNKNNQIIQIRRIKKIILTVIFLCVLLIGLLVSIKQTPSSQIINIPQVTQPQVTSPSPSSSSVIGEKHPNNRPNEDLKCSRFYDLNRKLTRNQTALSIQNYLCSGLDYVFDRYSEAQGKLYKMTNYKILLKTCGGSNQQSPTNDNVEKWNKDRLIAEWSLRKIKQNDKVLLVKSNKYNLLQIMLISHLVGAQGSLTVVSERGINGCLQQNMNMYNLNNINFQRINSVNFLKGYNVIISQLQAPEIKNAFSRLIQQSPEKSILLYLADHTQYSRVAAKMQINLFQVRDDLCSEPIISLPTQKQGYFSFSKKSQEDNLPLKKMDYTNSNVKQFVNEYNELMATRKSVVNKRIKQIQFIHSQCFCLTKQNRKYDGYTVSVYGSRLKGATQQEVDRWESEREPIEWTREKVKPNSAVYYEVRKLNLLTVTEISRIIAPAKLFVQCEQTDCTRIQKQKQFQSLNNIQIVVSSVDEALKANVIITDNEQIIDKAIAAEFLQKGQMLAYFTRERQTSFKVFAKILPNNRITQIEAYSQECMGYHQKHYFWDIDKMGQFYEIVPSNEYRIFTYWNGSPKILTPNRRQSLKQFIDSAMVQLKIFNQQTFLLVEGLMPIHEAFKYMQPGHQSDYLRVFMIHSFGGAWADVKHHHYDWRPYFKKLYDDPTKLALGYHQKAANHVGCHQEHGPPACSVIYANYRDYIGNGEFIYKKNTVLTQQIAARVTKTLDTKLEAIKANPPRIVRDYFGRQDQYGISKYPLRWAEVFGQYTARVAYDHPGVYLYDLPYVLMIDYI